MSPDGDPDDLAAFGELSDIAATGDVPLLIERTAYYWHAIGSESALRRTFLLLPLHEQTKSSTVAMQAWHAMRARALASWRTSPDSVDARLDYEAFAR